MSHQNRNKIPSQKAWGFDKAQKSADPTRTESTEQLDIIQELAKTPGGSTNTGLENHLDLYLGSNRAYVSPTPGAPSTARPFVQKQRNFGPGSLGESDSLDKLGSALPKGGSGVDEALDQASKSERVAKAQRAICARFHKLQGHTNCNFCQGLSYPVAEQMRLDKAAGINRNKPRELQYQPTISKV
jgi:hypothetical protein